MSALKKPDWLTHEQVGAIVRFARANDRNWRCKLLELLLNHTPWVLLETTEQDVMIFRSFTKQHKIIVQEVDLKHLQSWEDDRRYCEAAHRMYHKDGEIEVDGNAAISKELVTKSGTPRKRGKEEGAYVQAWVWVPRDEIEDADV